MDTETFYVDSIEVTVYFDSFDNSWAFALDDDGPLGGSYGYESDEVARAEGREHAIQWLSDRQQNTVDCQDAEVNKLTASKLYTRGG